MAVDLSSQRVRLAMGIIEGMRVGQSLGALLGYRFERHLHDAGILQLRATMYAIRRQFPLAAQQIKSTKDDTLAIEAIAAIERRRRACAAPARRGELAEELSVGDRRAAARSRRRRDGRR